jgi:hypothetical protein
MNKIAEEEDLAEPEKTFTSPRKVGWLLKRLRVSRAERDNKAKHWTVTRAEVEALARAYGMSGSADDGQGGPPLREPGEDDNAEAF